ncbi:uncharacterized protein MONBRDRAFT_6041 [Monosiga brevicollis MX1]|uniref:Laminin EGF-like domain-containing protein n=1 Tax=Monosiga brevicollis TaxID=81824 RepID=A9URE3_MONBE|nr:uncharacterized protein MONBRDRAFT_6041 [Monosiga brevicollis MX1]EDQ92229.1 predicted protein [Monosiga brevicollis MX1]|eukprot:XP_001743515.1 hypothetical protein [Monosiga brevicollis MX1]
MDGCLSAGVCLFVLLALQADLVYSSLLLPPQAGSLRHGARAIATETCGARSSSESAVPPYNLLEHDALDYAQQHHSSTPPAFAPVDENVCLVAGLTQLTYSCGHSCSLAHPDTFHPPSHILDGDLSSFWQGPPGMDDINVTISLDPNSAESSFQYHLAYVLIRFNSPKPAAMVIERSTDGGHSFTPWRYMARDCQGTSQAFCFLPPYPVHRLPFAFTFVPVRQTGPRLMPRRDPSLGLTSDYRSLEVDAVRAFVTADHIRLRLLQLHRFVVSTSVQSGINCERCLSGFFRPEGVSRHAPTPCSACNCVRAGASNQETGQCTCREGMTGQHCDQCATGYTPVSTNATTSLPCAGCTCLPGASASSVCAPNGTCSCRGHYIQGHSCDHCSAGTFAPVVATSLYQIEDAINAASVIQRIVPSNPNATMQYSGLGLAFVRSHLPIHVALPLTASSGSHTLVLRHASQASALVRIEFNDFAIAARTTNLAPCLNDDFCDTILADALEFTIQGSVLITLVCNAEMGSFCAWDALALVPRAVVAMEAALEPAVAPAVAAITATASLRTTHRCSALAYPLNQVDAAQCARGARAAALSAAGDCQDCDCHTLGAVSPICDEAQGACTCRPGVANDRRCLPGVAGPRCDQCVATAINLIPFVGCATCNACSQHLRDLWHNASNALGNVNMTAMMGLDAVRSDLVAAQAARESALTSLTVTAQELSTLATTVDAGNSTLRRAVTTWQAPAFVTMILATDRLRLSLEALGGHQAQTAWEVAHTAATLETLAAQWAALFAEASNSLNRSALATAQTKFDRALHAEVQARAFPLAVSGLHRQLAQVQAQRGLIQIALDNATTDSADAFASLNHSTLGIATLVDRFEASRLQISDTFAHISRLQEHHIASVEALVQVQGSLNNTTNLLSEVEAEAAALRIDGASMQVRLNNSAHLLDKAIPAAAVTLDAAVDALDAQAIQTHNLSRVAASDVDQTERTVAAMGEWLVALAPPVNPDNAVLANHSAADLATLVAANRAANATTRAAQSQVAHLPLLKEFDEAVLQADVSRLNNASAVLSGLNEAAATLNTSLFLAAEAGIDPFAEVTRLTSRTTAGFAAIATAAQNATDQMNMSCAWTSLNTSTPIVLLANLTRGTDGLAVDASQLVHTSKTLASELESRLHVVPTFNATAALQTRLATTSERLANLAARMAAAHQRLLQAQPPSWPDIQLELGPSAALLLASNNSRAIQVESVDLMPASPGGHAGDVLTLPVPIRATGHVPVIRELMLSGSLAPLDLRLACHWAAPVVAAHSAVDKITLIGHAYHPAATSLVMRPLAMQVGGVELQTCRLDNDGLCVFQLTPVELTAALSATVGADPSTWANMSHPDRREVVVTPDLIDTLSGQKIACPPLRLSHDVTQPGFPVSEAAQLSLTTPLQPARAGDVVAVQIGAHAWSHGPITLSGALDVPCVLQLRDAQLATGWTGTSRFVRNSTHCWVVFSARQTTAATASSTITRQIIHVLDLLRVALTVSKPMDAASSVPLPLALHLWTASDGGGALAPLSSYCTSTNCNIRVLDTELADATSLLIPVPSHYALLNDGALQHQPRRLSLRLRALTTDGRTTNMSTEAMTCTAHPAAAVQAASCAEVVLWPDTLSDSFDLQLTATTRLATGDFGRNVTVQVRVHQPQNVSLVPDRGFSRPIWGWRSDDTCTNGARRAPQRLRILAHVDGMMVDVTHRCSLADCLPDAAAWRSGPHVWTATVQSNLTLALRQGNSLWTSVVSRSILPVPATILGLNMALITPSVVEAAFSARGEAAQQWDLSASLPPSPYSTVLRDNETTATLAPYLVLQDWSIVPLSMHQLETTVSSSALAVLATRNLSIEARVPVAMAQTATLTVALMQPVPCGGIVASTNAVNLSVAPARAVALQVIAYDLDSGVEAPMDSTSIVTVPGDLLVSFGTAISRCFRVQLLYDGGRPASDASALVSIAFNASALRRSGTSLCFSGVSTGQHTVHFVHTDAPLLRASHTVHVVASTGLSLRMVHWPATQSDPHLESEATTLAPAGVDRTGRRVYESAMLLCVANLSNGSTLALSPGPATDALAFGGIAAGELGMTTYDNRARLSFQHEPTYGYRGHVVTPEAPGLVSFAYFLGVSMSNIAQTRVSSSPRAVVAVHGASVSPAQQVVFDHVLFAEGVLLPHTFFVRDGTALLPQLLSFRSHEPEVVGVNAETGHCQVMSPRAGSVQVDIQFRGSPFASVQVPALGAPPQRGLWIGSTNDMTTNRVTVPLWLYMDEELSAGTILRFVLSASCEALANASARVGQAGAWLEFALRDCELEVVVIVADAGTVLEMAWVELDAAAHAALHAEVLELVGPGLLSRTYTNVLNSSLQLEAATLARRPRDVSCTPYDIITRNECNGAAAASCPVDVWGDANGDCELDLRDLAALVFRSTPLQQMVLPTTHLSGLQQLNKLFNAASLDFNGDGALNQPDTRLWAQAYLGLPIVAAVNWQVEHNRTPTTCSVALVIETRSWDGGLAAELSLHVAGSNLLHMASPLLLPGHADNGSSSWVYGGTLPGPRTRVQFTMAAGSSIRAYLLSSSTVALFSPHVERPAYVFECLTATATQPLPLNSTATSTATSTSTSTSTFTSTSTSTSSTSTSSSSRSEPMASITSSSFTTTDNMATPGTTSETAAPTAPSLPGFSITFDSETDRRRFSTAFTPEKYEAELKQVSLEACCAACETSAICRGAFFWLTKAGETRCHLLSDLGTPDGVSTESNSLSLTRKTWRGCEVAHQGVLTVPGLTNVSHTPRRFATAFVATALLEELYDLDQSGCEAACLRRNSCTGAFFWLVGARARCKLLADVGEAGVATSSHSTSLQCRAQFDFDPRWTPSGTLLRASGSQPLGESLRFGNAFQTDAQLDVLRDGRTVEECTQACTHHGLCAAIFHYLPPGSGMPHCVLLERAEDVVATNLVSLSLELSH